MLDTFDFDPPPNIPWTKNMKVFFLCVERCIFPQRRGVLKFPSPLLHHNRRQETELDVRIL